VGAITEWPAQMDEVQVFSTTLDEVVAADAGYALQMTVTADGAPLSDAYPTSLPTPERRVLRHYGCKIDYELP
jgi:hypothetical protein